MAKTFDKDSVPADETLIIFAFKALLKAAGWTVPSSSDGTTYNSSGDQITTGTSGAGGLKNSGAWFRIQDPGGVREFVFQRNNDINWWIKYSASAKFTGGSPSASVAPTATDGVNVCGTSSSGSQLFRTAGGAQGSLRVQMMADNSAPYTFYLFTYSTGGSVSRGCFFMDSLQAGSYNALDADPVVIGWAGDGSGIVNGVGGGQTLQSAASTAGSAGLFGWIKYGLTGATWVSLAICTVADGSGNTLIPAGSVSSQYDGNDEVFAPLVGRSTLRSAPQGFKGVMSNFRWSGVQRANSGDTLSVVTTKDYIVFDKCVALPWDGSTPAN